MNFNGVLHFLYSKYPFRKGKYHLFQFVSDRTRGFILAKDEFGQRLLLDLNNHIDNDIYLRGSYEKECMDLLARWATAHAPVKFIDIGANIGSYTTFFARHPAVEQVYAFEPDPKNFAHLLANLLLNDLLGRVETHSLALSNQNGETKFYLSRLDVKEKTGKLNTSTSSLNFLPGHHQESCAVDVSVRRADEVLPIENEKLLIKIDVEGHEVGVLEGMEQLLRSNTCLLFVEVWRHNKTSVKAVEQLLHNLDYQRFDHPDFKDSDNRLYFNKPFPAEILGASAFIK